MNMNVFETDHQQKNIRISPNANQKRIRDRRMEASAFTTDVKEERRMVNPPYPMQS